MVELGQHVDAAIGNVLSGRILLIFLIIVMNGRKEGLELVSRGERNERTRTRILL